MTPGDDAVPAGFRLTRGRLGMIVLLLACLVATTLGSTRAGADEPGPQVTVALLPSGTDLSDLDQDQWSRGLMSAGMGPVPALQTMLDIGQGARVTPSSYDLPLVSVPASTVAETLRRAQVRAETAPRKIRVGALNEALLDAAIELELPPGQLSSLAFAGTAPGSDSPPRKGSGGQGKLKVVETSRSGLESIRKRLGPDDTVIAIETPGDGSLLDIAVAGDGFNRELASRTTHLVPLVSSVDVAPTILDRLAIPIPDEMEGAPLEGGGSNRFGSIPEVEQRLEEIRSQRSDTLALGMAAIFLFFLICGLIWRWRGLRFAAAQTAVGLPLALVVLLVTPRLRFGAVEEFLLMLVLASALAWALRRWLGDLRSYATACGLALATVAIDLVAGLDLVPYSILGSNPIGGVRFFGIGNELESILACCLFLGVAAGVQARDKLTPRQVVTVYLVATLVVLLFLVPGRFGADVGAVVTLSAGAAAACLLLLRLSWKLVIAVIVAPFVLLGLLALIDLATGASSHFTRTILGADSIGEVGEVLVSRLEKAWHTVLARSYRLHLILTLLLLVVLAWFSRGPDSPLRRYRQLAVGLYSTMAALLVGAVGNDSGTLLILAGAPFVFSFWAMLLTLDRPGRTEVQERAG